MNGYVQVFVSAEVLLERGGKNNVGRGGGGIGKGVCICYTTGGWGLRTYM